MDFSLKLLVYQIVNFIILIAVLGFLFNRYIRPFMKKRSDDIRNTFADIEKQKTEVEGLKNECRDQLDQIKKSAKAEIEKATVEGSHIKEAIKGEALRESEQLLEKARREIDQEKQKALSEVRREVATLSILATKQLLKREIDEATDRKLVESFIDDLGKTEIKKN
ncbi:MAG TPA: F0F1 ATP synthase subunit B [Chitinivibrionales bacterium]|nr:F0F1 ATP synthase subunit B [Chitinivibrionales bacterium]